MGLRSRGYLLQEARFSPASKPKNISEVNQYLKQKGYGDYRFLRGRGYFYLTLARGKKSGKYGDPSQWYSTTSVYWNNANGTSFQGWLRTFKALVADAKEEEDWG